MVRHVVHLYAQNRAFRRRMRRTRHTESLLQDTSRRLVRNQLTVADPPAPLDVEGAIRDAVQGLLPLLPQHPDVEKKARSLITHVVETALSQDPRAELKEQEATVQDLRRQLEKWEQARPTAAATSGPTHPPAPVAAISDTAVSGAAPDAGASPGTAATPEMRKDLQEALRRDRGDLEDHQLELHQLTQKEQLLSWQVAGLKKSLHKIYIWIVGIASAETVAVEAAIMVRRPDLPPDVAGVYTLMAWVLAIGGVAGIAFCQHKLHQATTTVWPRVGYGLAAFVQAAFITSLRSESLHAGNSSDSGIYVLGLSALLAIGYGTVLLVDQAGEKRTALAQQEEALKAVLEKQIVPRAAVDTLQARIAEAEGALASHDAAMAQARAQTVAQAAQQAAQEEARRRDEAARRRDEAARQRDEARRDEAAWRQQRDALVQAIAEGERELKALRARLRREALDDPILRQTLRQVAGEMVELECVELEASPTNRSANGNANSSVNGGLNGHARNGVKGSAARLLSVGLVAATLGLGLLSGCASAPILLGQSTPPAKWVVYIDITGSTGKQGQSGNRQEAVKIVNQFYTVAPSGSTLAFWRTSATPGRPVLLLERKRERLGVDRQTTQEQCEATLRELRAKLEEIEKHRPALTDSPIVEDVYFISQRAGERAGSPAGPAAGKGLVWVLSDWEVHSRWLHLSDILERTPQAAVAKARRRFPSLVPPLAVAPDFTLVYFPGKRASDGATQEKILSFASALIQGWGAPAPKVTQPENLSPESVTSQPAATATSATASSNAAR